MPQSDGPGTSEGIDSDWTPEPIRSAADSDVEVECSRRRVSGVLHLEWELILFPA